MDINLTITLRQGLSTDLAASLQHILTTINDMENRIMNELDNLKADVAAEHTIVGSVLALVNGFAARLDAAIAAGNPAALIELSTSIKADTAALAAAVTANTPPA